MNDDEFEFFSTSANAELKEKQAFLTNTYGFGSHKRWMFENNKATLQFFNHENQLVIEADIIDIGSYSPSASTWKWAWAYESIDATRKADSLRIKELEDITDLIVFGEKEPFEADEYLAWELAAIAVKHLDALGCYRAFSSARNVNMFFAIMAVHVIDI